jgi:hypothetical protein
MEEIVMDKGYQFNSDRYVTKGVMAEIPHSTQCILWACIDKLREKLPLDYLQVFKLEKKKLDDRVIQHIVHSQEEFSPFTKVYDVEVENSVNAKIYVIDDVEYQTMLLADEY